MCTSKLFKFFLFSDYVIKADEGKTIVSVYTKGNCAYVRSLTSLKAAFKPYGVMTVTYKEKGDRKLMPIRVDLECFSTANAERLHVALPGK